MKRDDLGKKIYEVSHLTGEFQLRSGKTSTEYFDKYLFESNPGLLYVITEHMRDLLTDDIMDFNILAGLEMGGIPLATMLSQRTGKPAVFVRKKAKEYGTKKLAEGVNVKGRKVLIVEDVVTSGGAVIKSIEELEKYGAHITGVICVIDREAGGAENLLNLKVPLKSLFTMTELKKLSAAG